MKIRDNPSFKGTFGLTLTQLRYFNVVFSKSSPVRVCKDVVATTPIVVYTTKDFYLVQSLNEKIDFLKSAGLIEFWRSQYFDNDQGKADFSRQPRVLNFVRLKGIFNIWMAGNAVSLIALVVEILFKKISKPN